MVAKTNMYHHVLRKHLMTFEAIDNLAIPHEFFNPSNRHPDGD
jgi:hypothetical protein